jgi:ferrous iron transport protein A
MNASLAATGATSVAPVALSTLHRGATGVIAGVVADDGAALGDETGGTIVMRLIELGFVSGEPFEIIAEARPGGDPIAVRIGGTCFALRRREAAAVMVLPAQP